MHVVPSIFTDNGKRPKKPPRDELMLTEHLDKLGPDNRVIQLLCSKSRAHWWASIAQGIINRTARESLIFLRPNDSDYGFGQYAHIEVSYDDTGVKLEWLPEPPISPHSLIVQALAVGQVSVRPKDSNDSGKLEELQKQLKGALARMRAKEKYVELHLMLASVAIYIRDDAVTIISNHFRTTAP